MRPLVVALLLSLPGAAHGQGVVAIVGLTGLGLDNSEVQPFERLLVRTVADLTGGKVLTPEEITVKLIDPSLERLRHCNGEVTCYVDLGGIVDAEWVLHGNLARLGDNYNISLRAVDVLKSTESQVSDMLSGKEDELIQALRKTVTKLLDPSKYAGKLLVIASVPEAQVTVDGTVVSMAAGPIDTTIGQHAVVVSADGYRSLSAMVEVRFGEVAKVDAELEPAAVDVAEMLSVSWPAIAMGLGGAGILAGGALGYLTYREEKAFQRAYKKEKEDAKFFSSSAERGESYALWTNIAVGVGAALLTAGLVGWLWPDDAEGIEEAP